jgi:PKD repeat protein
MKKTFTLLAHLFLGATAMAQSQLPNANFENWSTDVDSHDSLNGWSSSNPVVMYPVLSLRKVTDAQQGTYAAKVTTAPFGFVQYSTLGVLVNGNAEFSYGGGGGGSNVEYVSGGGTPISIKPSELKGYYKYITGSPSDKGLAKVLVTKYNTTTNKRDTVSYATYSLLPQATYTAFTIPLPDLMPGTNPDTITTIFYSSDISTLAPNGVFSDLFLDSLTLSKQVAPPVANFVADVTTGTTSTVVSLTDNSTNTPTAWTWTFTPNTVAYQSGTTASSPNPIVKFTAAGTYTVKLKVANADGSDSLTRSNYILIQNGTGIEDKLPANEMFFYPNPAKDKIVFSQACAGASITVTDVYGKTVVQLQKAGKQALDISNLTPGMYFVSVYNGGQVRTAKLLIRQ